jgi:hypothetical protein
MDSSSAKAGASGFWNARPATNTVYMESLIAKVLLIVFAIVGVVVVLALLGMWLMHGNMMSMMGSSESMAAMCRNMLPAVPGG